MPNLSDELHVRPKQRVTIPEGHIALFLPQTAANDAKAMLFLIRKGKRLSSEEREACRDIAGDLLLALIEAENAQL